MKLIALAAALAMGGVAVAQEAPQTTTTATPQDTTPQSTTTMPDTTGTATDAQAPTGTTGAGTATDATGAAGTTGTAPMDNTAGASTMGPMTNNPAPAAQASYPPCSRTVTDQCRQRGGR